MSYSPIVTMEWLFQHIDDLNIRIVDCRFSLSDPQAGKRSYEEDHLLHAVYFDLDEDLSSEVTEHGGRHPLPNLEQLARKLGDAGIDEHTMVVAYDDQGGPYASRFWWLLRYMGHEHVYVLDGGYTQWRERGFPISSKKESIEPRSFPTQIKREMLVDMNMVKVKLHNPDTILIDAREEKRFLGEEEPIDRVAGHIPGAINLFWRNNLNERGDWKCVEELMEEYQEIPKDKEIIVYCGSGVTACPNVVSLQALGYKNSKLYAGSWSDWISYPNNPIACSHSNK